MTPIVLEGNKIKACTSVKGVGVGRAEVPTCSKKERVYTGRVARVLVIILFIKECSTCKLEVGGSGFVN